MTLLLVFVHLEPSQSRNLISSLVLSNRKEVIRQSLVLVLISHKANRFTAHILMQLLCQILINDLSLVFIVMPLMF